MNRRDIEHRMAGFMEVCRRQGLRVTHQRTEVLRELLGAAEHPDAETLHRRVRRRIPAISLDTVYRTLRMLEEKGVISTAGPLGDRSRFDANTDRHHHFVCRECGMIGDFYSTALDRFPVPGEVAEMGRVETVYVEMRGRCRKCQERLKKRNRK